MHADPPPSQSVPSPTRRNDSARLSFLAADVGGTHARVGLMRAEHTSVGAGASTARPLHYRAYACADYAGLAEILQTFLAEVAATHPHDATVEGAAIAAAGQVQPDGTLVSANLPWPVSRRMLRERLRLERLELINDFEAVAHATPAFAAVDALLLSGPQTTAPGPVLVVGPGTGLGAALWIPDGDRARVVATEAGQASLAPGDATELALLGQLMQQHAHVPAESVLSGPGLLRLYVAICGLHGAEPTHRTPEAISAAALAGHDAQALASLHTFCAWLGGTVGDLALQTGAQCVYLAGGILPHIRPFLAQSRFALRFCDKGAMRATLAQVPVRLIEHGQLGVIGAATWYLHGSRAH